MFGRKKRNDELGEISIGDAIQTSRNLLPEHQVRPIVSDCMVYFAIFLLILFLYYLF